jgi:hypothetical protein
MRRRNLGIKTWMLTASVCATIAALASPASAESYRELTKNNPVAKTVWSSSGDNVRHKPSGMECAIEQGTATLVFLKTVQGDTDKVTKTGCRYELASGPNWYIEITPATTQQTDAALLEFAIAARAEVGGLVGVAPGPVVAPAQGEGQTIVPYALAIFSETTKKRSAMWFGEVSGWRIVATARLYDDSVRKEVEQQAADAWALAAAGVAERGDPPESDD